MHHMMRTRHAAGPTRLTFDHSLQAAIDELLSARPREDGFASGEDAFDAVAMMYWEQWEAYLEDWEYYRPLIAPPK